MIITQNNISEIKNIYLFNKSREISSISDDFLINNFKNIESLLNNIEFVNFINQLLIYSKLYTNLEEDLDYSEEQLYNKFPWLFETRYSTKYFEHNPERLADYLYCFKYGNGNQISHDGWKYRGRGLFKIRGKSNYEALSYYIYNDNRLILNPDLLLNLDYSTEIALNYWKYLNCKKYVSSYDCNRLSLKLSHYKLSAEDLNNNNSKYSQIKSILIKS